MKLSESLTNPRKARTLLLSSLLRQRFAAWLPRRRRRRRAVRDAPRCALPPACAASPAQRRRLCGLPWQCRLAGAGRVPADRGGPPGPSGDAGSRRGARHDCRRVPAAGRRDAGPAVGLEAVGRERRPEPKQPAGRAEPDGPVGAGVRGAGRAAGGGRAAVRRAAGCLVAEPGPPRQPAHRR